MSDTTVSIFCPECSTLLTPIEKKSEKDINELFLTCDGCSYEEKTNTYLFTHFTKINSDSTLHPSRIQDYIYDMSYERTRKIKCLNDNCSSKNNKNPEIVMITSEDCPDLSYICTECKYIWGKYKK